MGHDFISFRGQQKQFHDTDNQILYGLAIEASSQITHHLKFTQNILNLLNFWKSGNFFNGVTGTDFTNYIQNKEDIDCFLELMLECKKIINDFGDTVPKNFLNKITEPVNGPLFTDNWSSKKILGIIDTVTLFIKNTTYNN
jgi:hypothetical protein